MSYLGFFPNGSSKCGKCVLSGCPWLYYMPSGYRLCIMINSRDFPSLNEWPPDAFVDRNRLQIGFILA